MCYTRSKYDNSQTVNLRSLEKSSKAAANQEKELLGEEDPGDLPKSGMRLTPQVQDSWSQKCDAQPKTKEHTPVCQRVLPFVLEQYPDPLFKNHHQKM